ncbi:hypothetical protein HPB50_015378 [Hyalomma asiaticum]|uniref:Uncharacterized protein n=1 Tax=Hyalomma asiaticum TaxID=266040 RepID=A0ACB7T2V3_HYAAI|nr:hypothetical protein HPB50_015378 [Hyalomma asiaticum]
MCRSVSSTLSVSRLYTTRCSCQPNAEALRLSEPAVVSINALIYISAAALPGRDMARAQSPAEKPFRAAARRRRLADSGEANSRQPSGKDPHCTLHLASDVHAALPLRL